MSKLQEFVARFPWVHNDDIPFYCLTKPLRECKISIVSTGGLYEQNDLPFAIATREDVDQSFRVISADTSYTGLRIRHDHYNKSYAEQDLNVVFPLERLKALAAQGFIGEVAHHHYSITGYIPQPTDLFQSGHQIAAQMLAENVDLAVIVPV